MRTSSAEPEPSVTVAGRSPPLAPLGAALLGAGLSGQPFAGPPTARDEDGLAPEDLSLAAVEHFLTAARVGGWTEAALTLGIAEDEIRRSVAGLERQLGVPLLALGEDGLLHPSRGGALIADVCRALRRDLEQTVRMVRDTEGCSRGGLAPWQLRRATQYLTENLRRNIPLAELSGLVGLSATHFCNAFKQSTGLPPHRWQMRKRVERAKELMTSSSRPLVQIALECGFADQGHLSTVFRKVVGVSPATWRRQVKA
ncbi:MAG: helix-turn-helix domain-containing protein [Methylobacteriaceae bacterium]|nr:helix-turn-helix domain-containing protein [Methylobacteriaceae bacterium]